MKLMHSTVEAKFDLLSTTPQDTPQGKGFTFAGHGSAWAKDLAGNVLQKGAFETSIKERVPIKMVKVRWMHEEPFGFVTAAKEDDIGLHVEAFVPDTPTNRERIILMQSGVVDKMSIGFDPLPDSITYTTDERHIGKVTLYEVSAVDLPLNEATDISSVVALGLGGTGKRIYVMGAGNSIRSIINPKEALGVSVPLDIPFADITTPWTYADALGRVNNFYAVTDKTSPEYDACFLWAVDTNTDPAKRVLLIVDMTGAQDSSGAVGTPAIIPAAVEDAANAVNNGIADQKVLDALGIPATDLDSLKVRIDGYYSKMATTFNDSTLVSPWNTGTATNDNSEDTTLRNTRIKETFKGATISATNMQLLKQAADNINSVMLSANAGNDVIETHSKAMVDEFAGVDWSDTLTTLETLMKSR